jgi:hypothetical protein
MEELLKQILSAIKLVDTKLNKQEVDIRILKREILKELKDIKNG